ncbi:MAG: radical SAM protein [Candidatus Aminicenantes bacterium]|nr:radical SAM protein [Candidatus Aminicenantes bacterium]NIM82870.1 radical SAM protein [Candidatus Aminicenantes bacterium]NIN22246.1 radical SAM protein [Candidatus Aminicenantes bacterium]NIN46014.1 radical SAM protein [Candidatus Aminicenantes bacterium]NIN88850.1 radical SAM protein [Candidatus Aminicenantes bacterium]
MKVLEKAKTVKKEIKVQPYKSSKYNHFFEQNGFILAYNAYTNCFAEVTPEKYKIIKAILKDPGKFQYKTVEERKLKDDLTKGGFLVPEELDEFELLKLQNRLGRFQQISLGLTIAPTVACNFRCTYCFESHQKERMTKEVETALVKFVDEKLKIVKSLNITWFGGEPLMALDVIERLAKSFKELCETHHVDFPPASIITNGYLLTKKRAEILKQSNVASAQITIDGPSRIHDRRRKLANGKGTFARIIKNIKESMNIIGIMVRVNLDKTNEKYLDELYEIWRKEGLANKVPFYFGHVQAYTEVCADISSQCFSTSDYSALLIKKIKEAQQQGVWLASYPSLHRSGYCTADKFNTYTIAPSGYLFKCWGEVSDGLENSIGSLDGKKSKPVQIKNLTRYLNWDPFEKDDCKKCNILPICAGGCPYTHLNPAAPTTGDCSFWKYNLHDMLRLKYDALQRHKKIKSNKGGKHEFSDL